MSQIYKDADLADLKAFVGDDVISDDAGALNEKLGRLLDAAFTIAQNITGLTLNRVEDNGGTGILERFTGNGLEIYRPKLQPVVAVVSLYLADQPVPAATRATYTSTGHYVEDHAVMLRGYTFPKGGECFLYLTYGLENPPEDLRQAIIELAAIKAASTTHLGQRSSTGVSKETTSYFDSDITPSIQAVFDRYTLRFL